MDFEDSPGEAKFRSEVRAWLEANAERRLPGDPKRHWSLAEYKAWQAKKAAAGYAVIPWPKELGGRDGAPIEQAIYAQEEANFHVGFSTTSPFSVGLGNLIPTVIEWGTAAHRERYVRPAVFGEEIWCQLFSEPAAGSDLASIRTRAVRDGDDWIVNGQKVWTSGADFADFGLIVTRTDATVPKHRGLTVFFLDMRSPGVEARPIRQADGGAEFCEVFLTDVRIPDHQRLGNVGEGWRVAITTLMHERNAFGSDLGFLSPTEVLQFARRISRNGRPAIADSAVRNRLADWYVDVRGLQLMNFRALTALSKGDTPGPEQSIQKLVNASQTQAMALFTMELLNEAGALQSDVLGDEWRLVEGTWWWGAALRIAGGTDEVMRNIIAERVLGLPADIRADKDVPFRDLRENAE